MTHTDLPPEDAFDRWLDDLAEDPRDPGDNAMQAAASELHRRFGLAPAKAHRLNDQHKASLRQRIMPQPTSQSNSLRSSGSVGIVATAPPHAPQRPAWTGRRAVSLVSAAILVLLALASVGIVLRLDDSERVPGGAATASLMPFAPSSVLASATPVPTCATGDTLVLMPESAPPPETFDDLAFPVAWYQDGMLTVEQHGELLREIEIGPAANLEQTTWPDVLLATTDGEIQHASLVNISTGEVAELGPMFAFDRQWTKSAYLIWASDASHFTWHIIDLRTFERVDLNERFRIEPVQRWWPSVPAGNSSNDGTVILIETPLVPSSLVPSPTAPPATPDQPVLQASRQAILVNGDLDHLSLVGPMSRTSADTALSPDGEYMAWLAPSEAKPHKERMLTIAETATGEIIGTRPVEATYSNSLLFSRDGSILHSTSGTTLEHFLFAPDMATPVPATQPIRLPEPGYSIAAASPDRSKLILSIDEYAYGPALYWIDLDTGTLREIDGVIGRMWQSTFPISVAPRISPYFLIKDLTQEVGILDMKTGERVLTINRNEGGAVTTISPDGHTLMIPTEHDVKIVNFATGETTVHLAPSETGAMLQAATISSEGSCVAISWQREDGVTESALLSTTGDTTVPLPASTLGGWIPVNVKDS